MSSDLEELKEYHIQWWETSKDPREAIFKKLREIYFERIPRGDGKKAIDLGSGKGTIVSILLKKGYHVTAVEVNEIFCEEIKRRFPSVRVLNEDIRELELDETFDVVTASFLFQYFKKSDLNYILNKIKEYGKVLFADISNKKSLHGFWVEFRGFKSKFVTLYTPDEFENMLKSIGFDVVYRKGVGFITPITLFNGFRGKLIPISLANAFNKIFEGFFYKHCHMYYIEAVNRGFI